MANYYTLMAADRCVPCTRAQFNKLKKILETVAEANDQYPGLDMEYWDKAEDPNDYGVYITSDESFNSDDLPEAFSKALGKLIEAAEMPFLQVGLAYTCDKLRPQSHGGDNARFYPDGSFVYRKCLWPEDIATLVQTLRCADADLTGVEQAIEQRDIDAIDDHAIALTRGEITTCIEKLTGVPYEP
jgi:hypothetical protein